MSVLLVLRDHSSTNNTHINMVSFDDLVGFNIGFLFISLNAAIIAHVNSSVHAFYCVIGALALWVGVRIVFSALMLPDLIIAKSGAEERKWRVRECGLDLSAAEDVVVPAGARAFVVDTGIRIAPRSRSGVLLLLRSSASLRGLRLCNSVGVIDPGYRGTIRVIVDNVSDSDLPLPRTTAFAQLCLPGFCPFVVQQKQALSPSEMATHRGEGGLGSTGSGGVDRAGATRATSPPVCS